MQVEAVVFYPAGYWGKKYLGALKFTTSTQTLSVGLCSGITTIQSTDLSGNAKVLSADLTVNLAGTNSMEFYTDSDCSIPATTVTILSGSSSTSFYFVVPVTTGTSTISATATDYTSSIQNETLSANNFLWTGANGNGVWSTGGNWSGGVAPSTTNIAVFNGTACTSSCSANITGAIDVKGIRMASNYTGTITQNSGFNVAIRSGGLAVNGGTFQASSSSSDTIGLTGNFSLAGGTFNAGAATTTMYTSYWNVRSGTFNRETSTLVFNVSNGYTSFGATVGNELYNNVIIQINGFASYLTLNGTMDIRGNLSGASTNSGSVNSGTFLVSGDINLSGYGISVAGSTKVKLQGATTHNIVTSGSTASIPDLEIAIGGGTVNFSGELVIKKSYKFTSGTLNAGSSTLTLLQNNGYSTLYGTFGSEIYNNVTTNITAYAGTIDLNNTTLKVAGTLNGIGQDSSTSLQNGTIQAMGNITLNNYGVGAYGTGKVVLAGTSSQSITTTGSNCYFPSLEIASTGGTVSFSGTFGVYSNYKFTSGNLSATGSTMKLGPVGVSYTYVTATFGSEVYDNIYFGAYGYASTVTLTGTLNVGGTLTAAMSNGTGLVSGTINATGPISLSSYGLGTGGSTVLKTSGAQTITATGANSQVATLTVNSATTLSGALKVNGATSVSSGNLNLTGSSDSFTTQSLALAASTLTRNGGAVIVNGSTVPAGSQSLYGGTVAP